MLRFLFAVCTLLLLSISPAQALVQRAYVSALTGNDTNTATNCQVTAPCRWFAGAISVVASEGEIVAMDSGAYGTVVVNKSVAIVGAPGVYAGITVFSSYGVTIATPGVEVVLRGLTINGLGGSDGIYMTAGSSLLVQDCVISNFTNAGLYVSATARLTIVDSLFKGNFYGVAIAGNAQTTFISGSRLVDNNQGLTAVANGASVESRVDVSRSDLIGNNFGAYVDAQSSGLTELNIKDSAVSGNNYGIYGYASSGGVTRVSASRNLVSHNTGQALVASGSGAKLVASGNEVTHNGTGFVQNASAVLQTTGDNISTDNTTPTSGTITTLSKF